MAAVLTYDSLVTDLITYCERDNDTAFQAQIPRLVMYAENRVATDLKVEGVQQVVTNTLAVGQPNMAKPTGWRDTVSFQLTRADGTRFNVFPRTYEYARQYWPDSTQKGEPRYYAEYNFENFLLVPTPDIAYAFELIYHAKIQALDTTNEVNWLTMNAPQLLFYAAMLEAQTYLKNDAKTQLWAGFYNDSLQAFGKEDSGRKVDRTIVPT